MNRKTQVNLICGVIAFTAAVLLLIFGCAIWQATAAHSYTRSGLIMGEQAP